MQSPSKEEVLCRIERLRSMAASNTIFDGGLVVDTCNTTLGLSVDLSMAVNLTCPRINDDFCATRNTPVQLELLPLRPIFHASQLPSPLPLGGRGIDVNQIPSAVDRDEVAECSPSIRSSFQSGPVRLQDSGNLQIVKRDREKLSDAEEDRTCEVSSRASDEEATGQTRKKLRLTKEQSSLLEESFKEHNTLNPKQKHALAKQLDLRPRQVEVWFQNRRARTKLKQTEVDCELLRRCCECLTEENKRLQRELQELRAIKIAPSCVIAAHDFYVPLPAATLTMCPSCEKLATMDNTAVTLAKPQFPQISQVTTLRSLSGTAAT